MHLIPLRHRAACAALMLLPLAAAAHVTVTPDTGAAGSSLRVALAVTHGCAGSPTTAVAVTLPPGVVAAKPMAKPGWQVTVEQAPLAAPVELHGRRIDSAPRRIVWTGGPLANEQFDEFVLLLRLPDAPGELLLPVRQSCVEGSADWSGASGSATPAPRLRVQPAPAGHAHH